MIFPPEQQAELLDHLQQTPLNWAVSASRWSLALLRQSCTWLSNYSLSGIWRILQAQGWHSKRGQQRLHSPDPEYGPKRERIQTCVQLAQHFPDQVITLFLDEFSFYRWPTPAPVYAPAGVVQPAARIVPSYNTRGRVVAALEVVHGQVLYQQRAQITLRNLNLFLHKIRQAFPQAEQIFVIQDNWHNVHFHPLQVEKALELGITLVPLPTYAPWLNPIEKLFRWVRQTVIHMHVQCGDWSALKARVTQFLDQFASGSLELLRYVGLLPV